MRVAFKALMFGIALAAMLDPVQAQTQLTVMVFQGVQNLPLFAAQTKGFFARRGLEVHIKVAPNSDEMRNGLAEGRYQVVHGAVGDVVRNLARRAGAMVSYSTRLPP